jgi:hypothetical protein
VLVLAGAVTSINLMLSLFVGLRLLVLARRNGWAAPELTLAAYFLFSAVLATPPQIIVYGGMSDPRLAVPDALARPLLAFAVGMMVIGAGAIYVFTWKTFHPERLFAKAIVLLGCLCLVAGYLVEALYEGFTPVIFAGVGHWIGWLGRSAAMFGVCFESLRYYRMLRRRLRIGLADPVVTDRFLLWTVWAAASTLNYVADLLSRSIYVLLYRTTEAVPEYLAATTGPVIVVTMVLGSVSAVTLFLTFFPTPAYRRWVATRSRSTI